MYAWAMNGAVDVGLEVKVSPDEVKKLVGDLDCQVDEFGSLLGEFQDLAPPTQAFGMCAQPSAVAAKSAHMTLMRAMRELEKVFQQVNQNIRTAMNNYQSNDRAGASTLDKIAELASATASLVQRLRSSGLDPHNALIDQNRQVSENVALVYSGQPGQANFKAGDTVTAPGFVATVGADGRLYQDGRVVSLPGVAQIWLYRPMAKGGA